MATKKIKLCDNKRCKKIIEPNQNFLWFPFYGFNGRIFCDNNCLHDWADDVSEIKNISTPNIQIA